VLCDAGGHGPAAREKTIAMKKTLLVLSLVLVAGALALLWRFTSGGEADAPAVATPHGASPTPAPVKHDDVAILPKSSDDDTNATRHSVEEEVGQESRTAALLADATWVDVDVRLPANTPTDEKIELFAVVFAPDKFKDDNAVELALTNYKAMRVEGGFGFSPRRLAPSDGERAEELPCERTANGQYRAPFPKGSKKGLLRLSARYAYLSELPTVELPAPAMSLSPELGAWLTGHMHLPSNLPSDIDPNALAPFDINLNGWKMSGEHHGELLQVAGRLEFEIGGLRAGLNYFLQGTSPQFVAFNDMGPGGGTHTNTTTYAPGTSGVLKNITNGAPTGVSVNITTANTVVSTTQSSPSYGTPAFIVFDGFVDFVGDPNPGIELNTVSSVLTYSFSGLDPSAEYNFQGTGIRGDSTYTDRWTLFEIGGATSFTSLQMRRRCSGVVAVPSVATA